MSVVLTFSAAGPLDDAAEDTLRLGAGFSLPSSRIESLSKPVGFERAKRDSEVAVFLSSDAIKNEEGFEKAITRRAGRRGRGVRRKGWRGV